MTKSPDPDFYITCATVIPVLFLGVAVQGRAHQSVLEAALAMARARRGEDWTRRLAQMVASWLMQGIAYGIILAGGVGEFFALLVLYRGFERPGDRAMVFAGTLLLMAAVIAGPFLAYMGLRSDLDTARYGPGAGQARGKHEPAKGAGGEQQASCSGGEGHDAG